MRTKLIDVVYCKDLGMQFSEWKAAHIANRKAKDQEEQRLVHAPEIDRRSKDRLDLVNYNLLQHFHVHAFHCCIYSLRAQVLDVDSFSPLMHRLFQAHTRMQEPQLQSDVGHGCDGGNVGDDPGRARFSSVSSMLHQQVRAPCQCRQQRVSS